MSASDYRERSKVSMYALLESKSEGRLTVGNAQCCDRCGSMSIGMFMYLMADLGQVIGADGIR